MKQKILPLILIPFLLLCTSCNRKKTFASFDQAADPDSAPATSPTKATANNPGAASEATATTASSSPILAAPIDFTNDSVDKNTLEDANPVKSIEGTIASLEKPMPDLKVGGFMYFPREPYRFPIVEVDATGMVKVNLGPKHDVRVGQMLLKHATESMRKSISTLNRLETTE